jgi:hypothetical protein
MKYIFVLLIVATLAACTSAPSESAIQTAIAQTQVAAVRPVIPTLTVVLPTETPKLAQTSELANIITGDPQTFVLVIADLPTGFSADKYTGPSSNEVVASSRKNPQEFLAQLEKWGRITGYTASYTNLDGYNLFHIESSVVMVKTSNGAHDYFEYLKVEGAQAQVPISVPVIGDESYGTYGTVRTLLFVNTQIYQLNFRKQNVIVTALVHGYNATILDATNYARIVEARLSGTSLAGIVEPSATPIPMPTLSPIPQPTETPVVPSPTDTSSPYKTATPSARFSDNDIGYFQDLYPCLNYDNAASQAMGDLTYAIQNRTIRDRDTCLVVVAGAIATLDKAKSCRQNTRIPNDNDLRSARQSHLDGLETERSALVLFGRGCSSGTFDPSFETLMNQSLAQFGDEENALKRFFDRYPEIKKLVQP